MQCNRDQFTSTVCHELRNILNTVSLHAQMLTSEQRESVKVHASRIVEKTERFARLVEDMGDVAELESQRFSVDLLLRGPSGVRCAARAFLTLPRRFRAGPTICCSFILSVRRGTTLSP
jgi:signal transduction histidine kinase